MSLTKIIEKKRSWAEIYDCLLSSSESRLSKLRGAKQFPINCVFIVVLALRLMNYVRFVMGALYRSIIASGMVNMWFL